MFCPQCRHTWPSRSSQAEPPAPMLWLHRFSKAKPGPGPCPVCHGPLVPDRLEQEFPPVAHASKSEPSLSMADILREIGPLTSSPGTGGLNPRDPAARGHDDAPLQSLPPRAGRSGKPLVSLDVFLGFSALAAVVTMMISVGIGIIWNAYRMPVPHSAVVTAGIPAAVRPAPVSQSGSVLAWPTAAILAALPASVPGGWHRWESAASLTQSDDLAATGQRMAVYQRGTQTVHVWLLKTPEDGDALTAFGGAARFVHTPQTLLRQSPVSIHVYGRDCLAFVDVVPRAMPHSIEASHPFAVAGWTLTWYRQGTLVTIAADDLKTRDDFAGAYAPQH